ncbi:MAG: hypothetical protein AAGF75_00720 [Cyanobacteria bacterium P01_H01_bin.130]
MSNLINISPGTLYYQTRWDFLGITADPSVWNEGWSWRDEESTAKIQKAGNEVAARLLSVLVSLTRIELGKRADAPSVPPEVGPWLTQSSKFLNRWLLGNNKAPQTIRRAMTLLRRLGLVEAQKPKEASRTPYRYRVVLKEVNRAVQYFSSCMVTRQQDNGDGNDDGNDAYFPLSDRPSYPIPPDSVTPLYTPVAPNSPPVAPSYAPVARSCNGDEYSCNQGARSLNTKKFIPSNDLSNKQVIERDPEADADADFLSPVPGHEAKAPEPDSLADPPGDALTVKAEILDEPPHPRTGRDRPVPPPILNKNSPPPPPLRTLDDDYRWRSLWLNLERHGLEALHNGAGFNDWSDGAVNAVIQAMAKHNLQWDEGMAKQHLTRKAQVGDFARLELYRDRLVQMAEEKERSRQIDAVIDHPQMDDYLATGGELPEDMPFLQRMILEERRKDAELRQRQIAFGQVAAS